MPWFGMTRREENHQRWEDDDTEGAIRAKGREARRQAALKAGRVSRSSHRNQRNNRREY
jgi:hypothetical protein